MHRQRIGLTSLIRYDDVDSNDWSLSSAGASSLLRNSYNFSRKSYSYNDVGGRRSLFAVDSDGWRRSPFAAGTVDPTRRRSLFAAGGHVPVPAVLSPIETGARIGDSTAGQHRTAEGVPATSAAPATSPTSPATSSSTTRSERATHRGATPDCLLHHCSSTIHIGLYCIAHGSRYEIRHTSMLGHYTRLMASFPGKPGQAGTRKVTIKPVWIWTRRV